MNSAKCHICYQELGHEIDYHQQCLKSMGITEWPHFERIIQQPFEQLASAFVASQQGTVAGVMPKILLSSSRVAMSLPNVGFIYKPAVPKWPELAENEHLTHLLAQSVGLEVAKSALVRSDEGFGLISKRFDINDLGSNRYHVLDMAQILELKADDKYRSSYERVAKAIKKYSDQPVIDLMTFYKLVVFSFLCGNSDLHLKNISLLHVENGWQLSPCYDLVNVKLANPDDREQLALTLNSRKNRIKSTDLLEYFPAHTGLSDRLKNRVISDLTTGIKKWPKLIANSFLSELQQENYVQIVNQRLELIGLPKMITTPTS